MHLRNVHRTTHDIQHSTLITVCFGQARFFTLIALTLRNPWAMGVGTWQVNLSNTGDCSEYGLISQCSEVSSNFGLLAKGEPRLLYMDGHIGAFIGEEVVLNGFIYNCIESTAWGGDFGHDGIIYTYVDQYGRRLDRKSVV